MMKKLLAKTYIWILLILLYVPIIFIAVFAFTEAKTLASANVSVIPYIAAGVFYYIMNGVIEMIMTRIEKSMSYYS